MANYLLPLAACLLLLSAPAWVSAGGGGGDEDPTGSLNGVSDLTPDNFDKLINGGKHAIIEFYAPWCGHCKRLTPEYKKLGEIIENDPKLKTRVIIAKADADAHRSLGEKFDVKGFPTIKYLPRGKPATKENAVDYNAGRTAEAFLEFIKEKLAADSGFARVEALADIASKFLASDDKAGLIKEARALAASFAGDDLLNSELYFKIMQKVVDKGTDYAKTEKARLDKLLASASVHASKVEEMTKKSSILGALLGDE